MKGITLFTFSVSIVLKSEIKHRHHHHIIKQQHFLLPSSSSWTCSAVCFSATGTFTFWTSATEMSPFTTVAHASPDPISASWFDGSLFISTSLLDCCTESDVVVITDGYVQSEAFSGFFQLLVFPPHFWKFQKYCKILTIINTTKNKIILTKTAHKVWVTKVSCWF